MGSQFNWLDSYLNHSIRGVLEDHCHLGERFSGSFKNDYLIIIFLYKHIGSVMIFEGTNDELD